MFEGDSAVTRAGKIPLMSIGGRAESPACAKREPPSARAEFFITFLTIYRHSRSFFWEEFVVIL
jgi:hypothetical protein